ncbi:hypothetical protein [Paenibacillus harenae]|uniref:hypothetical protein n=1 Tax=Paenibacillus harenae TaxID=306543 RepID=UPI002794E963|nr:hypothetical protein [Paenibacillus harenae]MDQ0058343.1 hypothetical protein [Paenibacillus harenae]
MEKQDHEHDDALRRDDPPRSIDPLTNAELNNVNEEMSADFAVGTPVAYNERDRDLQDKGYAAANDEGNDVRSGGYALGWVALVFGIASWFLWPVLLGATSAVLGFIAYRQGARGLGGWSMAIGLLAVVMYLVIVPFYYAIT